jgi:hypothetical protein
VVGTIVATRANTEREHRRLVGKGMKESEMEQTLESKLEKDVMKAFAGTGCLLLFGVWCWEC